MGSLTIATFSAVLISFGLVAAVFVGVAWMVWMSKNCGSKGE